MNRDVYVHSCLMRLQACRVIIMKDVESLTSGAHVLHSDIQIC
jgi:hypothetical protein